MRKIKFRCWHECDKSMTYDTCPCKNESGTMMQFTGLLDRQGKEIYQGDIVREDCPRGYLYLIVDRNGGLVVINKSEIGSLVEIYEACADMQTASWLKEQEVIGNIYENPDLLKE